MTVSDWLRLVFTIVVLVGCGGTEHGSPPPGHLRIAPAELRAGESIISLHASGKVSADGRAIGTLHRDGRLVASNGSLIASLSADGRVTNATGYVLDDVVIDGGGELRFQGRIYSVQKDGVVTGAEETSLRVEVDRVGRRAAMFVLLVAALSGT